MELFKWDFLNGIKWDYLNWGPLGKQNTYKYEVLRARTMNLHNQELSK